MFFEMEPDSGLPVIRSECFNLLSGPMFFIMNSMIQWIWKSFSELDTRELYTMLALRAEVFVVEQNCPYQDLDGLDTEARHLLVWDEDRLAAYCRVLPPGLKYPEAAIGRVVTAPSCRGLRLGHELMARAVELCRHLFPDVGISLSAQAHLRRFYEEHGFSVEGEGYLEDGIPHLHMRREPG